MPISTYDQPAQAQFMQTYVPMPFQEMAQAGQMKQQRWDAADAMTQQAQTMLGDIPALDQVTTSTGQGLDVGDAKFVEKRAEEISNKIENLTSTVADKSSPEYRSQVTGIITELRKEMGSRGLFGKSAANVERYQQLKEARKEAELGGNYHRAVQIDKQLARFSDASKEGITDFNVQGNFLPEVDVNEVLQDSLGDINDVILNEEDAPPGLYLDNFGKIRQRGHTTGISLDRVRNAAKGIIQGNRTVQNDLQAQAETYGYDYEELVDSYADNMARIYAKQNPDISWSNMPSQLLSDSGRGRGIIFQGISEGAAIKDEVENVNRKYSEYRSNIKELERLNSMSEDFSNIEINEPREDILETFNSDLNSEQSQKYLAAVKNFASDPRAREMVKVDNKGNYTLNKEVIPSGSFGTEYGANTPEQFLADQVNQIGYSKGRNLNLKERTKSRIDNFIKNNEVVQKLQEETSLSTEEIMNVAEKHETKQSREHLKKYPFKNKKAEENLLNTLKSKQAQDFYEETSERGDTEFEDFVKAKNINSVSISPATGDMGTINISFTNEDNEIEEIGLSPVGLPDAMQQDLMGLNSLLRGIKGVEMPDGAVNIGGMEIQYNTRYDSESKELKPNIIYRLPGQEDFTEMQDYGEIMNHALTSIFSDAAYSQRTSEKPAEI